MSPVARILAARSSRGVLDRRVMAAGFATCRASRAKNQIYAPVRRPEDLHTYTLLSSSARTPLLTLWTTSAATNTNGNGTVAPTLRSLVESGVGEPEGGVSFCEVECDAPDVAAAGLAQTHMVDRVPVLLSFDDAGLPVAESRVEDAARMADAAFLAEWIRGEARRSSGGGSGGGGAGGGDGKGGFRGLFMALRSWSWS
ncbi:hypothetical protein F5Y14DRAFT_455819 [Nemania sp. NC0429]|nr:hypothetical protein F5Y14DRAFT_455819 [Nemania sp. NC0429]